MEDREKTKDQLIHELVELRKRVAELEVMLEDRQWMEKVLQETKEGYRLLVETMNDGLGVQDEDGLIVYVNNRFCDMLGYSQDDLIERPMISLLDETNQKIMNEEMIRRRMGKSGFYEIDYMSKGGKKISTAVTARPIIDADGRYKGSFAVIRRKEKG